jgi:hypothetical protein
LPGSASGGVQELLLPEPETVPQPQPTDVEQTAAVAEARPVAHRRSSSLISAGETSLPRRVAK